MRRLWQRLIENRARRAVAFLGVLAALFLTLSFLVHHPSMQHLDLAVTRAIQAQRSPILDALATGFSFLGNTASLCVVGAFTAVGLWRVGMKRGAWLSLASLLGVPLNMLIKEVVGRPRPSNELVEVLGPTIGLSFPSGHAMASTLVFGFLALLAWIHAPSPGHRLQGALGFVCTAISISLSRVYLGAHWFSDILGGMTAGAFLVFIFAEIYEGRPVHQDVVAETSLS